MISIIIPSYNEETSIEKTLIQLLSLEYPDDKEILVVDGGSSDNTISIASKYAQVISSKKGKAIQLNWAVNYAKGDILFFVHADMLVPNNSLLAIYNQIEEGFDGGGFANEFDSNNKKIKRLGTLMNMRFFNKKEQADRSIFYGDNGIFVKKSVFLKLGGFKEIPIMEDYDFSIRMKNSYRVRQIKEPKLMLSSRRHIEAGFFKTRMQWILIKKLFLLGFSPHLLNKWYRDVR